MNLDPSRSTMQKGAHSRRHKAFAPETGIPGEDEVVAMYCKHSGRERIDGWNFYLAFSMFRLASILQGVYARGLQGNAASAHALQRGAAARRIAERGFEVATGG